MNKWDHLPNAKLIDWVLTDLKANPGAWPAASAIGMPGAMVAAWRVATRDVVRKAAWRALRDVVRETKFVVAKDAAMGAIAAFVVYDNCFKYLDMTPDELRVWGELSDDPACLLLLPMVIRKNK